jgi:CheY-like chemotaxis protein
VNLNVDASSMADQKTRVLVVDDDEMILEMLCFMLDAHGFEAVGAVDGSEGLTKACASSFDVIVLDNMMPGMSGEQLARRLILIGCVDPSQVVMITGGMVPADAQTFAHVVLRKPFEIEELLLTIKELMLPKTRRDPPA